MADHGSITRYTDGCRCDDCRAAASVYRKQYRQGRRLRQEKAAEIKHGTPSAYRTHKCRCDVCVEAQRKVWAHARRGERVEYPEVCTLEGCDRPHLAKGWCKLHYYRVQRTGEPGPAGLLINKYGEGCVTPNGYRMIAKKLEHRSVMEEMLGRELLPHESVHHKNGDKLDNRPENLELWSKSQPAGQRVADKVLWAEEIISLYGDVKDRLM